MTEGGGEIKNCCVHCKEKQKEEGERRRIREKKEIEELKIISKQDKYKRIIGFSFIALIIFYFLSAIFLFLYSFSYNKPNEFFDSSIFPIFVFLFMLSFFIWLIFSFIILLIMPKTRWERYRDRYLTLHNPYNNWYRYQNLPCNQYRCSCPMCRYPPL